MTEIPAEISPACHLILTHVNAGLLYRKDGGPWMVWDEPVSISYQMSAQLLRALGLTEVAKVIGNTEQCWITTEGRARLLEWDAAVFGDDAADDEGIC